MSEFELAQRVRALEVEMTRRPEIGFHDVIARASTAAGQVFATGTTPAIVDFGTVDFDPWSAITTGAAWKFTAPVAGYYMVSAFCLWASSTAWAIGEIGEMRLYKNGSAYSNLARNDNYGATASFKPMPGVTDGILLAAGEYIDIRCLQTTGGNLALFNNATYNHVLIRLQH